MPESVDVRLPRNHEPIFPDRCVVCDERSPSSQTTITTRSVGWWTVVFWAFGQATVVRAPACSQCGWRLHFGRWVDLVVLIATTLLAFFYVWPMLDDVVAPEFRRIAQMGTAIVCLIPAGLYRVFHAHAFDVTAYAKSIDYEFASPDYARDFEQLNRVRNQTEPRKGDSQSVAKLTVAHTRRRRGSRVLHR